MNSLPYELLQLIASNLLPRYQCRLALTSKWCYQWLYSSLLKWHTNKQYILLPNHKTINCEITIIVYNNQLLIYTYDDELCVKNLTSCSTIFLFDEQYNYGIRKAIMYLNDYLYTYEHIRDHSIEIFDGYYKYMHSIIFRRCISIRMSPLLSLPSKILKKILPVLGIRIIRKIHPYLTFINFY